MNVTRSIRTTLASVASIRLMLLPIAFALLLAGCGSGGDYGSQPPPPPQSETPPPVVKRYAGRGVVKVQTMANGWIALTDKPISVERFPAVPDRVLVWSFPERTLNYAPPAEWSLIDFAHHPSGETSAILATTKRLRLIRFGANGNVVSDNNFVDPAAASDPSSADIQLDDSLVPFATFDAAKLAPMGEDLAVTIRTGRNAVVAYRYRHTAASGFNRLWRTLVEPGIGILLIGITSGTYDVFGQLDNRWHVFMDTGPDGSLYVAVTFASTGTGFGAVDIHNIHFSENLAGANGALVTRIAADGRRLGSTAVDTVRPSEVHGIRSAGDRIFVTGRVRTPTAAPDGSGWDGYVSEVDRATGNLAMFRAVDVDLGDVLFDVAVLPDNRLLAVGTSGYVQNPGGASISEQSAAVALLLEADGRLSRRIGLTQGPKHNELRAVVPNGVHGWLIAGFENGPGTHTADGNPALLAADGYVSPVPAAATQR